MGGPGGGPLFAALLAVFAALISSIPSSIAACSDLRSCAGLAPDGRIRDAKAFAIFLATKTPPHRCFVPALKASDEEQSYWVSVIINRGGSAFFAIDTGFTGDLAIPRNFLDGMLASADLTSLDRAGPLIRSTLADGSVITQGSVIIREIILPGCRAFRDVQAIISPAGSTPLLGQGILSRFNFAGIDHEQGGLVLVPQGVPP